MSLYPPILPLKAYRYIPFKDEHPKNYIDFICIRWVSDNEYLSMVLEDKLSMVLIDKYDYVVASDEWSEWQYGDVKVLDWHVDLKKIKVRICDIKFAKLQGL